MRSALCLWPWLAWSDRRQCVVLTAAPAAADAVAQPVLGVQPDACMCSRGVDLGGQRSAALTLYNCQCGALQCVVHAQSGQLQCR